jgi:hypothetical protein
VAQKNCPKLKAESKLCDKISPLEILFYFGWILEFLKKISFKKKESAKKYYSGII